MPCKRVGGGRRGTEKPTDCRRFLKIERVSQEAPWPEKGQNDTAVSGHLRW